MIHQTGICFEHTAFWVIHRSHAYGPFDYQWNQDFLGIEMLYQNQQFGEFCSSDEYFADLRKYELPMTVVKVATIVMGTLLQTIVQGEPEADRESRLTEQLRKLNYPQFARFERIDGH